MQKIHNEHDTETYKEMKGLVSPAGSALLVFPYRAVCVNLIYDNPYEEAGLQDLETWV